MAVPPELIALAVLLAANRLLIPRFGLKAPVFWTLNALDLAGAAVIYVRGVPGVMDLIAIRVLVGTLLLFHIGQNFAIRARRREEALEPERRLARLRAMRAGAEEEGEGQS